MTLQTLALISAAVFAIASRPHPAFAQEAALAEVVTDDTFDADRVGAIDGNGYTVSPGMVIHPSLAVQAGGVDNIYQQAAGEGRHGAGLLRLVGSFFVATDAVKPDDMGSPDPTAPEQVLDVTPRTYDLRVGGQLSYDEYLSSNDVIRSQRHVNARAMLDFTLLPAGPFTMTLSDQYYRDVQSPNFETSGTLDRDDNRAKVGAGFQSDDSTVSSSLYYENWVQVFESGAESHFANRMNHKIGLLSGWQWRPVTRFMWDVSYGFYGPLGTSVVDGMPYKTNSRPLRLVGGMATQITERVNLKAHLGYARASYERGEGYSDPIGGVELGLRWSTTGRVVMLYDFDSFDSLSSNFYRDMTFAAKAIQQVGNLVFDGGPELHVRHYRGIPLVLGNADRDDVIAAVLARVQLLIAGRLSLSAEYRFAAVQTDYRAITRDASGNPVGMDDPSYARNEFMLGVRAAY